MRKLYYVTSTLVIFFSAMMGLVISQESTSIERPAVASAVAPPYPVLAVASNTSGTVAVEVKVNASGEVISVRSVGGHPLLRQQAENTARRWRFIPAVNNSSVRAATLTFVFRIMLKETAADDLTPVFTPPYQIEVRHRPFEPVVDSDPPTYVRPTRQRGKGRTP
jgi:TonB family protein